MDYIGMKEDTSILVCGCGVGSWSVYLAKRADYVVAIDVSELMIKQAKKELKISELEKLNV